MDDWCKSCANYCENDDCCECEGTDSKHPFYEPKKKPTNADRIRAMTDEELAAYLSKVQGDIFRGEMRLTAQWLDWLKQEAAG